MGAVHIGGLIEALGTALLVADSFLLFFSAGAAKISSSGSLNSVEGVATNKGSNTGDEIPALLPAIKILRDQVHVTVRTIHQQQQQRRMEMY
jgi:hypothetical protein